MKKNNHCITNVRDNIRLHKISFRRLYKEHQEPSWLRSGTGQQPFPSTMVDPEVGDLPTSEVNLSLVEQQVLVPVHMIKGDAQNPFEAIELSAGTICNVLDSVGITVNQMLQEDMSLLIDTLNKAHEDQHHLKLLKKEVLNDTEMGLKTRLLLKNEEKGLSNLALFIVDMLRKQKQCYDLSGVVSEAAQALEQRSMKMSHIRSLVDPKTVFRCNKKLIHELATIQLMLTGGIVYEKLRSFRLRVAEFREVSEADSRKHFALNLGHQAALQKLQGLIKTEKKIKGDEKALYHSLKRLLAHIRRAKRKAGDLLAEASQQKERVKAKFPGELKKSTWEHYFK